MIGKVLLFAVVIQLNLNLLAQDLPLGYIVHFQTDFSDKEKPDNLLLSGNSSSKINNGWFVLSEKSDSVNQFTPSAAVLIDNNIFGEYIVSFRIKPKLISSDSSSACYLIFGLRDSLNYYYVTMNENNTSFGSLYKGLNKIHRVDSSMVLENNKIKTITIKRNILERKISISKNGEEISFTDPNLVMGYFGFGVEDAVLAIDKITIWAPTSIEAPAPLFDNPLLKN